MGGLATFLFNLAYQAAPAPVLATIDDLAVPGSLVVGALVWGNIPAPYAICSCLIVVGAGVLAMRPPTIPDHSNDGDQHHGLKCHVKRGANFTVVERSRALLGRHARSDGESD